MPPAGLLPFTLGQVYQVISPDSNKLDNVVQLHSNIVAPTLPGATQCVPVVCTRPHSCPSSCLVRHSVLVVCTRPDRTAAHPAAGVSGPTAPGWKPAANWPGDPAASCPCLLDPFDVMQYATASRQPAVPGRLSSLLSPLQLAEAPIWLALLALFVMLWKLRAAGKHPFALCVAGFPESKRAVLTATLKHSFEAVGGSAVQITFEDTEVGPAHLCSSAARSACTADCGCLSEPFLPCLHSWAALLILPAINWLPGDTEAAPPVLCCRWFCQRCLPVPTVVAGDMGCLQLTYYQHPMLPPATACSCRQKHHRCL